MAEWFFPGTAPQPAQEAVTPQYRQYQQVAQPQAYGPPLICSHCSRPIKQGESCMAFNPGISGFGLKSGKPMVVDTDDPDYESADLHIGCIYDYVFGLEETMDYLEDDIELCHQCGEGLEGWKPDFCARCGTRVWGK